ncbi:MAG: hypothetical protein J7498_05535 [Sphingobium sp.]|nr:hypothetical protein [Sphingobium sp.]
MPRDANGNYTLPGGSIVATGDTILPSQHNPPLLDIAQSMTNSLSRDGLGGMRAALDMGGFKISNILAATLPGDAPRLDQVFPTTGGTISGNVSVTGAATFGSSLTVTGAAVFNGNATVASQLNIGPNAIFQHNGTDGFLRTQSGKLYLGSAGTNHFSIDASTGDLAALADEKLLLNTGTLGWSSLTNFTLGPNSGVPLLAWDSGDYISYDRSINTMYFVIGNSVKLSLSASGAFDGNNLELGNKDLPQNAQTGDYTLVLTDRAKHLYLTSGSAMITIPPNSSVAYPIGTVIVLINNGSASKTVARGSGVALLLAGSAADANKTLAQGAVATIIKVATNTWFISGAGVS